jgi:hypothetical protein
MPKYTDTWPIDNGGEKYWLDPLWFQALEIVAQHTGEPRYGPKAPVYLELEQKLPGHPWWTDERRSVFRDYKDAWTRTGVLEPDKETFEVTPFGRDVLAGRAKREDGFLRMMSTLTSESGEVLTFQVLASAFLEAAPRRISSDQALYGIAQNYRPGVDDIDSALAAPTIPATRDEKAERRMKLMLARMVDVGAIRECSSRPKTWEPANYGVLVGIAGPQNITWLIAQRFIAALADAGLQFEDSFVRRFIASLVAKRFAILTGLSGSGKTKLADAFAVWLGCDSGKQAMELVPVGPDWSTRDNILGYPDSLYQGAYQTTKTLDLLIAASKNANAQMPDQGFPHILILDEMNLSHVERYFADFLSAIESERGIDLHNGASSASGVPEKIAKLPPNLFVVGTVNVDETTYMFSPKVLDRAHVLEFRVTEQSLKEFLKSPGQLEMNRLQEKAGGLAYAFVALSQSEPSLPDSTFEDLKQEILMLFRILEPLGREFAFRSAREMIRFAGFHYWASDPASWNLAETLDAMVLQKILPKLNGSRSELEPSLWALGVACYAPRVAVGSSTADDPLAGVKHHVSKAVELDPAYEPAALATTFGNSEPFLKLSSEKIARMANRLRLNGFASFAEA